MAKTSKEQIKKDERKVIDLLKKDAGLSVDSIAKKCGFSRQKVWRIIKRLENDHTIWGYTAIIEDEKIETKRYIALIKKTTNPINKELANTIINRDIEKTISKSKLDIGIENSYYVNGVYDWIICFTAQDIKDAKKFCELLNTTYNGYVADTQLLQELFPIRKSGIKNPNIEKLREFLL
jgi:DNA-binding Lrp family transcriptional regulator